MNSCYLHSCVTHNVIPLPLHFTHWAAVNVKQDVLPAFLCVSYPHLRKQKPCHYFLLFRKKTCHYPICLRIDTNENADAKTLKPWMLKPNIQKLDVTFWKIDVDENLDITEKPPGQFFYEWRYAFPLFFTFNLNTYRATLKVKDEMSPPPLCYSYALALPPLFHLRVIHAIGSTWFEVSLGPLCSWVVLVLHYPQVRQIFDSTES